jgi:hypothetical protein
VRRDVAVTEHGVAVLGQDVAVRPDDQRAERHVARRPSLAGQRDRPPQVPFVVLGHSTGCYCVGQE